MNYELQPFVEYTKTVKQLQIALSGIENELTELEHRLHPNTIRGRWLKWLHSLELEYMWEILNENKSHTITAIRAVEWAYSIEAKTYPEALYDYKKH